MLLLGYILVPLISTLFSFLICRIFKLNSQIQLFTSFAITIPALFLYPLWASYLFHGELWGIGLLVTWVVHLIIFFPAAVIFNLFLTGFWQNKFSKGEEE